MSLEVILTIVFVAVCIVMIAFGVRKKRLDVFVNFTLRAFVGLLAIYLCNYILQSFQVNLPVGMNAASAMTVGFLGTPGFLLLYGIAFYISLRG